MDPSKHHQQQVPNPQLRHWIARQRDNINVHDADQVGSTSLPYIQTQQHTHHPQLGQPISHSTNQSQFLQPSPYTNSTLDRNSSNSGDVISSVKQGDSTAQIPPFTARYSELSSSPISPPSSSSSASPVSAKSLMTDYPSKRVKSTPGMSQGRSTNPVMQLNYRPIIPTSGTDPEFQQKQFHKNSAREMSDQAISSRYAQNGPDGLTSSWFAKKYTQWDSSKDPNLPANETFPGRFHSAPQPRDNMDHLESNITSYAPELLPETHETDEHFWQQHSLDRIGHGMTNTPFGMDGRNVNQFSLPIRQSSGREFHSPNISGPPEPHLNLHHHQRQHLLQQQQHPQQQTTVNFIIPQQHSSTSNNNQSMDGTPSSTGSYFDYNSAKPVAHSSPQEEDISSNATWYATMTDAIQRLKDSVTAFESLIMTGHDHLGPHSLIQAEAEEIALAQVLNDSSNLTTAMSSSSSNTRIIWHPVEMNISSTTMQDGITNTSMSSSTSTATSSLPALPSCSVFLPYQIQTPCISVSLNGYIIEGNKAFLSFFELESNVDIASMSLLLLFPIEEVISVSSMVRRVIANPTQPLLSQQMVLVRNKMVSVHVLISAITLDSKAVVLQAIFVPTASPEDIVRDQQERQELVREVDTRLATETLAYGLHREAQKLSESLDEHKNKLLAQQNRYGITTKMIEPYLASNSKDGIPAKTSISNSQKPWVGMSKQQQVQLGYLQKVTGDLARLQFNHVHRLSSFLQALNSHSPFSHARLTSSSCDGDEQNKSDLQHSNVDGTEFQPYDQEIHRQQQKSNDTPSSSTQDMDYHDQMRNHE